MKTLMHVGKENRRTSITQTSQTGDKEVILIQQSQNLQGNVNELIIPKERLGFSKQSSH